MELHEALSQISEIRQQMARTEVFRGYRALPVAFSGVLALAAALGQSVWIRDPGEQLTAYLTLWMLPGLWQVLYSLGIFASCRLLPRATFGVAMFYLAAGLTSLTLARGDAALSPWAMGLSFGIGQFLAAGVLYRTLECRDVHA
jgi:hypothetical protein